MVSRRSLPEPDPDVEQFEWAVNRLVVWCTRNDVHQQLMRRAKYDLPRGHVWLLGRLDHFGSARLSVLALALGVDKSTLTPQVKRLERDGLILREADPSDGRASLLRLTRSGKALLARLHATIRAGYGEVLADWSATDRERLATLLGNAAALVEAITDPAVDLATPAVGGTRRR